ncbi:MAG: TolC family protein [bacterium]|jgi:cobalt-zinc-cadmium efflux system outer membrane protein
MNKNLICLLTGICLFLEATSVSAGDQAIIASATDEVSLGKLVEEAFQNHPEIKKARAEWSGTVERFPLETSLDDPMLGFVYYIEAMETIMGESEFEIQIEQQFPFPGTLRQQGRVLQKEIEIAELEYERVVRNVIADLKEAVYELHYIKGAIVITRQNQELLREILLYAQTKYSQQNIGLNEILRAESQLAQLEYDLITLRELEMVQQSVINTMLNRPTDSPIGSVYAPVPEAATPSLERLDQLALEQSQEVRLANLGVERAEEEIGLMRKRNLPMLRMGVGIEFMDENMPDEEMTPLMVSAGISIPLWYKKNRARVRVAEEEKQAALHESESVENTLKINLRKAYFELQNALRLVELYRNHLIPQAQQAMQIAEEWNRGGMESVSETLEVQSVWLNFNLAWLRAQMDYAQAYVQLERLAGGSLTPILAGGNEP